MSIALADIERQYYTTVPVVKLQDAIEAVYHASAPDTSNRARAAFLLGAARFEEHSYDEAKNYFEESRRLASALNDKRVLSDALHGEALGAFRQGEFAKVNALEEEALRLAKESGHHNRAAVAYFMLGTISSIYGSH